MGDVEFPVEDIGTGMVRVSVPHLANEAAYEQLEAALYEQLQNNIFRIIIDLTGCDYVESKVWGTFIWAAEQCRAEGGDTVIINPAAEVKKIYEVGGFSEMVSVADTLDDARAALAG